MIVTANDEPPPNSYHEIVSTHSNDENRDGFGNIVVVREEYIEPENCILKKFRQFKEKFDKKFESDHPEGYYYDPDLHEGFAMYYLDFTSYSRSLVENENFNYFIIFVIFLAGINVGIQTYPQLEDNTILNIIDNIILLVFSFEVIVKMAAEGLAPYMYFFGKEWKWNTFDFTIVFLSLPFWGGLFGGGSLALLRLVRLMRLAKLIKKIPALQMIVRGLTGGLSSIAYILLLLVLVFYLFAVTGFYLFSDNDPFHFGTLPIAMITMFRCATLDAWSDVMYLNIFGCDSYPYLYVVDEADFTKENRLFHCEEPKAQYVVSALYFVVFIVMSALVMLSLFIGAVTLSMNDSLVELKVLALAKKKKERYEKNVTKMFLANSRVEKRKEKKTEESNTSTFRNRLMSSVRKKLLNSEKGDLERFKTEMLLAPGLVALHREQSKNTEHKTRSAILNHKKLSGQTPPRTPPSNIEKASKNEKNFVKQGSYNYNFDRNARDDDRENVSSPGEDLEAFSSGDNEDREDDETDGSPESSNKRVLNQSLSMQDRLSNEQAQQIAAKEIEAIEKRKQVLNMIAEKNQGQSPKTTNFTLFLPETLKTRLDRSLSMRNEQQATEVGRLLRVAMGEQAHGEEEDPKSFSSFVFRMNKAVGTYAKYKIITEYCKFVAEHPRFVGMVTCVIVLAGINVGAQTESRLTNIEPINQTLQILDIFILTVFTIEVVLKILAEGENPFRYFRDGWNKFDFIIVVGSYIPGAGSLLTILRLLRLLRVLKLVKSLPQLAVIVNALIMGLGSIGYIGLILFMCFYVFAIAGMMLFRNNDPFHFGNLHIAMFTLFRCSTLDDWSEVLYVNMYGCDDYPGVYDDFPEMCDSPKKQGVLSCIYFFAFIVIGAQVLLTLFIGVVTTSMEQAKELQLVEQKTERQLASLEKSLGLSSIQLNCFKKAFYLLDLDGSGQIEEDEVALGLQSINNLMEGTSIEEEVKKSDPLGVGIDLLQFIVVIANIPRCRHRRLIKRTMKRWRLNKAVNGKFYVKRNSLFDVKKKVKKVEDQTYLGERPITHSHYTNLRLVREKEYNLLFSYFRHHKLAFQFFQKNEYSSKLDHLAFMKTKLRRRHSCSFLPETQYEQYLAYGKEFDISETQLGTVHSNTALNPNSLRVLNKKRRESSYTGFTSMKSLSGSSKNFFKTLKKSFSNMSEDSKNNSDRSNTEKPNSIRKSQLSPPSSPSHHEDPVCVHSPMTIASETPSTKSIKTKRKLKPSFVYGQKISPRPSDDDL